MDAGKGGVTGGQCALGNYSFIQPQTFENLKMAINSILYNFSLIFSTQGLKISIKK